MADHYKAAIDYADQARALSDELDELLEARQFDSAIIPRERVAVVTAHLNVALRFADVHATLSVTQALYDRAANAQLGGS